MAQARKKALADLSHWGGLQHMLDHFGKRAPPKAFLKAQALGRFWALKRFSGEAMGKHVDRAEMLLAGLSAVGMTLRGQHEGMCAAWLLNSADVDYEAYRPLPTVAGGAMEWSKVVAELRFGPFGGIGGRGCQGHRSDGERGLPGSGRFVEEERERGHQGQACTFRRLHENASCEDRTHDLRIMRPTRYRLRQRS